MRLTGSIRSTCGFSLTDLLMTVAVASTLMAIALPVMQDVADSMRLGIATREVERALQTARMRSVSANRPMQVRLNCPAVGQLRIVEVTGVAATDAATNRCDETAFPFPGPQDADLATPEHDGPLVRLHFTVSLAGSNLQFSPNGTAQQLVGGVSQAIATPVTVTVTKNTESSTVTINGLGKIEIQ